MIVGTFAGVEGGKEMIESRERKNDLDLKFNKFG